MGNVAGLATKSALSAGGPVIVDCLFPVILSSENFSVRFFPYSVNDVNAFHFGTFKIIYIRVKNRPLDDIHKNSISVINIDIILRISETSLFNDQRR